MVFKGADEIILTPCNSMWPFYMIEMITFVNYHPNQDAMYNPSIYNVEWTDDFLRNKKKEV